MTKQNHFHAARTEHVVMVIGMNVVVGVTSAEMERYRAIVADIDGMSDSQKEEAIMIVINMMQAFVDAAWGQHPVQQIELQSSHGGGVCGKIVALGNAKPVDLASEGAITKNKNKELAP
jgi:hypothetical protein